MVLMATFQTYLRKKKETQKTIKSFFVNKKNNVKDHNKKTSAKRKRYFQTLPQLEDRKNINESVKKTPLKVVRNEKNGGSGRSQMLQITYDMVLDRGDRGLFII